MTDTKQEYAFCETAAASGYSPWHIRRLTKRGKKLGGGADTPTLCGREAAWDLDVPIRHGDFVCERCWQVYRKEVEL